MSAWCKTNQCTIDQLKYWLYKAKGKSASSASTSPARWVPPYRGRPINGFTSCVVSG
ncbi:hypothetical protein [Paenibacillus apiarius]